MFYARYVGLRKASCMPFPDKLGVRAMTALAICGAGGRMGQRLVALASQNDRFKVTAALEAAGHPAIGRDVGELAGIGTLGLAIQDRIDAEFDVLLDFSLPVGTMQALDLCLRAKRPMLIGTTGHGAEQLARIRDGAKAIAILKAANLSVGVNVLFRVVGQVAAALGDEYDIEIVESHPRFKKDAPSGTAMELLNQVCRATGRDPARDVIYGRHGDTGERPARQIGMHALRVGDTVGEHEVHFGCLGETVVLRHSAHTRDTFARGALRAAAWLVGRPAGLYTMQDVLFGQT
jgi:4-hydroxy-tetrahydrodipicolinate reductase